MSEKINLTGVNETMLVPLYARAIESQKDKPEFIDKTAIKVMDNIDYNFKKRFKTSTNKMNFWGCSARTVILDNLTKEEAEVHPKKNMLMKAIGCSAFVEPDVSVKGFLREDIILMATDGLTNMVKQVMQP